VNANLETKAGAGPAQVTLEASVLSPDRQRLFGRASAIVHRSNIYVGLKQSSYFLETGKDWDVDMVVVRPDGQRAAGIPVTGQLINRQWMSVERGGIAGRLEWVSEQKDTVVSTWTYTSEASTRTWTFHVTQPGQYILKTTAQDESRRPSESSISFYAMGPGLSWWSQKDSDIVDVIPDKKSYKPGDIARLLVKSPYPLSRVLVTMEREGVMEHWITTLNGTANFIEVPLAEHHIPNVYVGVMLVQGRSGHRQIFGRRR